MRWQEIQFERLIADGAEEFVVDLELVLKPFLDL